MHYQSITAIGKNYRRSVNAQIIICSYGRLVVAGKYWPGNRYDVVVARATVATYSLAASATTSATVATAESPPSPHPGEIAPAV